jgi:hypothetical protein
VHREGTGGNVAGLPFVTIQPSATMSSVKAQLVAFGDLRIEGERFERDVVIEAGRIRRRRKGPSKARRGEFGHTPLTSAEDIP